MSETDFEEYESLKGKIPNHCDYLNRDGESKLYENYLKDTLRQNTLAPEMKKKLFLALSGFKYIGEKLLAGELMLFSNRDSQITVLSKMVNPLIHGLEPWLLKYSIAEEEVFNELTSKEYLRNSETIYNDIIVPCWEEITSSLKPDQVTAFLTSVKKYYKQSTSPVSLSNKAFIFTNEQIWSHKNISLFYHRSLPEFSRLTDIMEVIEGNGLQAPAVELLGLYSEDPFNINNSNIENLFNSAEYSAEAAIALLELCKGRINIFDYGYFKPKNNLIAFNSDRTKHQYYSGKESVHQYISKYCNDNLIALPSALSSYKENTLREQDLYKAIIDNSKESWVTSDTALQELLQLLAESGLTRIVRDFINERKQISLSENPDELTLAWMTLINQVFDAGELEPVREKILIEGIKLSELIWNNTVYINDETSVELGNILTRFNDNQIIANIKTTLLASEHLDNKKVNALFEASEQPSDTDLLNIVNEMAEEENHEIKNQDQLRLILHLNNKKILNDLSEFKIQAIDDDWYPLEDEWYLMQHSFVNDNAVIGSRYDGLKRINGHSWRFFSRPFFHRESNQFIAPHLKEELTGASLFDFLELVKNQLDKNAQTKVNWLDSLTGSIGFIPGKALLTDKELIHDDEHLPEEVAEWASKSLKNKETLEATGVNGENSPIVMLRKFLNEYSEGYSFEGFSRNSTRDKQLLKNTLSWMAAKDIELTDSLHAAVIRQITEFIGATDDISELLFPAGVAVHEGSMLCKFRECETFYYYTPDTISSYNSFGIGAFSEFISELIDSGYDIVDPDFLSKSWLENYGTEIKFDEPSIDIEKLHSISKDCTINSYLSWKENYDNEIEIRIINDSVPCLVESNILEEPIPVSGGDYFYDEENQFIYTKEEEFIKAITEELKDDLSGDELRLLLGHQTTAISTTREQELLNRIQELEEQLNTTAPAIDYELERGYLNQNSQRDWNLEARQMLRENLENIPEFDCSDWDDSNVPSSLVKGVKYLGKECLWIVRNAMNSKSIFHLTPYEWTLLGGNNVFLALRTSQDTIQIYGLDNNIRQAVFDNNHTINLNFDAAMLTLQGIDALASTLVHYNIWGSGLVFKNPAYSAGVSLADLSKCKDGIVEKLSDDSL